MLCYVLPFQKVLRVLTISKMFSPVTTKIELRHCCIIPIPKPKDLYSKPLTCDDFRGIGISSILAKVF